MATRPALRPVRRLESRKIPRSEERKEMWQKCALLVSAEYWIDAIILDRSTNGARVRYRSHEVLPDQVRVKCGALGMDQLMTLVWQNKGDAGLKRL